MPRQPRFLPPNNAFHIMCRGNNGNTVFNSPLDYIKYIELIHRYKSDHPFDLYHYCLMNNHVHFLVMIKDGKDFSSFMKKLSLSYFKYFQKEYGWSGHFWQDRFKSKLITQDIYLIQCGKYIELNPVRAGIVESTEDYHWSSYNFYCGGEDDSLLTTDIFFNELGKTEGEKRTNYIKMVTEDIFAFDNKSVAQGSEHKSKNAERKFRYHQEHKNAAYRK